MSVCLHENCADCLYVSPTQRFAWTWLMHGQTVVFANSEIMDAREAKAAKEEFLIATQEFRPSRSFHWTIAYTIRMKQSTSAFGRQKAQIYERRSQFDEKTAAYCWKIVWQRSGKTWFGHCRVGKTPIYESFVFPTETHVLHTFQYICTVAKCDQNVCSFFFKNKLNLVAELRESTTIVTIFLLIVFFFFQKCLRMI